MWPVSIAPMGRRCRKRLPPIEQRGGGAAAVAGFATLRAPCRLFSFLPIGPIVRDPESAPAQGVCPMHILLRGDLAQRLRIASGLILFTFATAHFLNTALGLVSLETMH